MDTEQEATTGRDIPLPIQREVRQRCGFGCVICGLPLYEYEHMLGWAKVQRHVAEEITLLCDRHHREKTSGLLPSAAVAAANARPHNLESGVSKPYDLHYSGSECEVILGGSRFTTTDAGHGTFMIPIMIDGVPILAFALSDEHLLLNLNLFDECNNVVLRIVNNELTYSTIPWDISLVGRRLQIREGKGQFFLDITFEVPNRVVISRARVVHNGVEVCIEPGGIAILAGGGTIIQNATASNVPIGLHLGTGEVEVPTLYRAANIRRNYDAKRRQEMIQKLRIGSD